MSLEGQLMIICGPGDIRSIRVGNRVVWVGDRSDLSHAMAFPTQDADMPKAERIKTHMESA